MVHADSSNFAPGASKREKYTHLHSSAQALFLDQRNWVWCVPLPPALPKPLPPTHNQTKPLTTSSLHPHSNLANTSSLLWHLYHSLPPPSSHVNWAGFYTLDRTNGSSLILGPFHGRPACQSIAIGRGVCGAAAASKKVVRVEDVREFPGHITCDGESRSEIVVPVLGREGEVVAIIDVDCGEVGGFDEVDEEGLGKLAELLGKSCDWDVLG